jgi:hypothetical protein
VNKIACAAACLLLSFQSLATPPNTTAANAVSYEIGQGWVSHYFEESTQNRWFKFTTVGGRSYCIEAAQGSDSPVPLDPNLTYFFDAAGATTALTNSNGPNQPAMTTGSRICFVDTTSLDTRTIRSTRLNVPIATGSGDNGYMRFRIYDTTVVAGIDWDTSFAAPIKKFGLFYIHNLTGTAITAAYQGTRGCTGGDCTGVSASFSGTQSIPPRGVIAIDPSSPQTSGVAFVSIGFAAPSSNVRVYRHQVENNLAERPILVEPVLPQ